MHCLPDQGLEDGVACVGHQARVPLHLGPQLGHVPIKVIRVPMSRSVTRTPQPRAANATLRKASF